MIGPSLLFLFALAGHANQTVSEIGQSVRWIEASVSAVAIEARPIDVVGHWSHSTGFGSSHLYVFPDLTYIYARSADVFPLTIYDKGRWRIEEQAVLLSSDADVRWDPETDHRYLALLDQEAESTRVMMGIDRSLQILKKILADEPARSGYLRAASLQWKEPISPGQVSRIRAQLMKLAWRPAFFESPK